MTAGLADIFRRKDMTDDIPTTEHTASTDGLRMATGVSDGATLIRGWTDPPSAAPAPGPTSAPAPASTPTEATAPVPAPAPVQATLTVEHNDAVDAPGHYCKQGIELGEVLYVWNLTHRRASAVEYIMRAGDKDPAKEVEDLRKAIRNLEMEITYMERYGGRQ